MFHGQHHQPHDDEHGLYIPKASYSNDQKQQFLRIFFAFWMYGLVIAILLLLVIIIDIVITIIVIVIIITMKIMNVGSSSAIISSRVGSWITAPLDINECSHHHIIITITIVSYHLHVLIIISFQFHFDLNPLKQNILTYVGKLRYASCCYYKNVSIFI